MVPTTVPEAHSDPPPSEPEKSAGWMVLADVLSVPVQAKPCQVPEVTKPPSATKNPVVGGCDGVGVDGPTGVGVPGVAAEMQSVRQLVKVF